MVAPFPELGGTSQNNSPLQGAPALNQTIPPLPRSISPASNFPNRTASPNSYANNSWVNNEEYSVEESLRRSSPYRNVNLSSPQQQQYSNNLDNYGGVDTIEQSLRDMQLGGAGASFTPNRQQYSPSMRSHQTQQSPSRMPFLPPRSPQVQVQIPTYQQHMSQQLTPPTRYRSISQPIMPSDNDNTNIYATEFNGVTQTSGGDYFMSINDLNVNTPNQYNNNRVQSPLGSEFSYTSSGTYGGSHSQPQTPVITRKQYSRSEYSESESMPYFSQVDPNQAPYEGCFYQVSKLVGSLI